MTEAYLRLSKAILISAKTNIPRGVRPSYIPCMNTKCQQLLEQYSNSGDPDIADHLVECLDNARRARWEEMTSSLDFTHSSRKGWNLIRKFSSSQHLPSSTRPLIKPNAVASHLVKVGKAPIEHQVKRDITKEWRAYRRRALDEGTAMVTHISPEEVDAALKNMKCGKAPGYDNVHPEFLKNLGSRAREWLAIFVSKWVASAVHGGCRRMACHKDLYWHRLSSTCTSMICQPRRAGNSFMPMTSALPTKHASLKISTPPSTLALIRSANYVNAGDCSLV